METKTALTIRIIAPWGEETGFRLAGTQVVNVVNEDELNQQVEKAIEDGDVGVLALPVEMEKWISEKNMKILKRNVVPLIARYDYPGQWRYFAEAADISDLLTFRAIGYHMRIRL